LRAEAEMKNRRKLQPFNGKVLFEKAQNPNIEFNKEKLHFLRKVTQLYTRGGKAIANDSESVVLYECPQHNQIRTKQSDFAEGNI